MTKTWEQIIAEKDKYVGGEFQSMEHGFMYKGPIIDIRYDNSIVIIVSDWIAIYDNDQGRWKYFADHCSSTNFDSRLSPATEVNNSIFFTLPHGYCTIFPNIYGQTLTPDKVVDFPI